MWLWFWFHWCSWALLETPWPFWWFGFTQTWEAPPTSTWAAWLLVTCWISCCWLCIYLRCPHIYPIILIYLFTFLLQFTVIWPDTHGLAERALKGLCLFQVWTGRNLGVVLCKLNVFLSEGCTFCTILHITFLSLERYLVVCWPITSKTLVTRRRTRALIGCLWLGAAASAAPFLVMMDEVKIEDHMGREVNNTKCSISESSGLVLAMIILYYLYVLVPLCILGLVYILIGRTLRLRPQRSRKDKSNQHTVRMLGEKHNPTHTPLGSEFSFY